MATQIPAKQEADLGVIHETCTSIWKMVSNYECSAKRREGPERTSVI